eukprot:scaffold268_cov210-Ochromonas_danica.AAC.4
MFSHGSLQQVAHAGGENKRPQGKRRPCLQFSPSQSNLLDIIVMRATTDISSLLLFGSSWTNYYSS